MISRTLFVTEHLKSDSNYELEYSKELNSDIWSKASSFNDKLSSSDDQSDVPPEPIKVKKYTPSHFHFKVSIQQGTD